MKTLSSVVQDQISTSVINPAYLVEIGFSTRIRGCTLGSVEIMGQLWPAIGIQVGEISTGQGGIKTVSISIINNAFSISNIVLAESASGKEVKVWKLFDTETELVFSGVVDEVPEISSTVSFNCTTANSRTTSVPFITLNQPFFNFLPRPGEIIRWGNSIFELEPR